MGDRAMGPAQVGGRAFLVRWGLAGVGLIAGGIAALHPMTRAIDYPLSLLGCVVLSLAGAAAGALESPERPLRARLLSMLQATAALLVVPAMSSQLSGRPCEPLYGLLFILMGPLPSGLCGMAAGMAARSLLKRPIPSLIVGVLFVALSPLVAVGEFLLTPCVRFYGTFFGLYHGAIYDEAVFVQWPYLWLRVWNALGVAGLLLLSSAGRRERGLSRAAGGAVVLCLFSLLLALGPRLGFVASFAPLEERLSERLEGPHIVVRFPPGGRAAAAAPLMLADLEFRHSQIRAWFGIPGGEPVTAWLYDSERQKGELMGAGRTSIAKPWLGQLHVHELQPGAGVLAHELAHVMLAGTSGAVLGLPSGPFGLPRPGLMEGAAVSVERGGDRMTTHQWARAMRDVGLLPDVAVILEGMGFWGESASRAYTACGSFVRYLVETRGPDAFARVYSGESFEAAYGVAVGLLVEEWQRFLDAIPLSEGDLDLARLVFSRPAVFGRVCPYAGGRCLERAMEAARRKDPDLVLRLAGQALGMTRRDLNTGLKLSRLLLAVGNAEGGLWTANQVSQVLPPEAGGAAVAAVDLLRADAYWLVGDAETAAAIYERLSDGPAGAWLAGPLRLRLLLAGRSLPEETVELVLDAFPAREGPVRAAAALGRTGASLPERFKAAAVLARNSSDMAAAELELKALVPLLSGERKLQDEAALLRLRLLCLLGRPQEAGRLGRELTAGDMSPAMREEILDWLERSGWLESQSSR